MTFGQAPTHSQASSHLQDDPKSSDKHIKAVAPSRLRTGGTGSAGDLRRLAGSERPRTPPPSSLSCWMTESTTPMTSRPHFGEDFMSISPPHALRRVRSRSLGSAAEAARHAHHQNRQHFPNQPQLEEYPVHFDDWRDLLLTPNLAPIRERKAKTILPDHRSLGVVEETKLPVLSKQTTSTKSDVMAPESLENGTATADAAVESLSADDYDDDNVDKVQQQQQQHKHEQGNPIWLCVTYGLINATIVLPVLMSFASIIYRDEAFAPVMPTLMKLTLVSGMVHQVCFSTFSSLPFAVGQVQDAGLIFLSSMATTIVDHCRTHGTDFETLLATATIGIPIATALLGVGLIFLGRWQLAQYVQLLPTCVVGGYLAYIGWFCGMAGAGLMAGGASEVTPTLLLDQWHLVVPGVVSGLILYVSVRKLKHMAVLPCGILLLLTLFYVVMWTRGVSLAQVTEQGWIRQLDNDASLSWTHTWDLMKFNKVAWGVVPRLVLTELSMIFVVALSSSLDVAAIELELQRPLDYNHELQTVGLSNLVSGLTGGYTGSYIFSQSIFSLRAGIRSRLAGYVLAACQLVIFLLPFPILSFVPNFFFGSLLSLICVDLLYEWLFEVRTKVSPVEYIICLSTFVFCLFLGVEYGILLGVFLYVVLRQAGLNVGNKTAANQNRETESLIEKESSDCYESGAEEERNGDYGTLGLPMS